MILIRIIITAILAGVMAALLSSVAHAADKNSAKEKEENKQKEKEKCALEIIHPGTVDLAAAAPYDIFSATPAIARAPLQIRARGAACAFAIGFSSSHERAGLRQLAYRGGRISYWLSPNRNGAARLRDETRGNAGQLLRGQFAGGGAVIDLPYFAIAPGGQLAAAGAYRDRLTLTAYRLEDDRLRRTDSLKVDFALAVSPAIAATLLTDSGAGPLEGASHSVRLGDLSGGAARDFFLSIRANVNYAIRLESENRGALRHERLRDAAPIAYEFAVDGARLSLAREVSLKAKASAANAARRRFSVRVPPATRALAGKYVDNIRITISAR